MLVTKPYNRERAVEYALRWAMGRNPLFTNFAGIGGDCTNFVSQSIYAGSCVMNYTPTFGWYYIDSSNRAPAWSGVEFFYNFITSNSGVGPYGSLVGEGELLPGDVIELGNEMGQFYHTLIVTGSEVDTYLISAHTDDSRNRRLDTYNFATARYIHIEGIRFEMDEGEDCFENLINGISL
ncbi:MAG: amidase domain-containing protein [Clostridia bacterium]|nr:amidase domain-containing protein [Clostridia bacterium]